MNEQPFLELEVHLANGNKHHFVQNDQQLALQTLQQINLNLFSQSTLVLYSESTVATYPTAALTGIRFLMESLPTELVRMASNPAIGLQELREISRDDFKARQHQLRPIVTGQPFVMLHEVELMSTHRLWLESHVQAAVPAVQERQIVQQVFSGSALACRRGDGGLSLWNRVQIVSYTFSPAPEVPIGAWPAKLIST